MRALPAERRIENRLAVDIDVRWTNESASGIWPGCDISTGGLRVHARVPQANRRVRVHFGAGDVHVNVQAEVVWIHVVDGSYQTGLRFVGLTLGQRRSLRALIAAFERPEQERPAVVLAPSPPTSEHNASRAWLPRAITALAGVAAAIAAILWLID